MSGQAGAATAAPSRLDILLDTLGIVMLSTPNPRNNPKPYYGKQKADEDDPREHARTARNTLSTIPVPPQWTDDHPHLLQRNVAAVLESLARTEREENIIKTEVSKLKKSADRAALRELVTIGQDELTLGDGYDPTGGPRGGSGSSGPNRRKFDDLKGTMDATSLTEGLLDNPPKRAKKDDGFQAQTPIDLAALNPQPIRLEYRPHSLDDNTDEWFTDMFAQLFKQAERFVIDFYGIHDLDRGVFFEPWACGITPEFVSWAELVAEPDPAMGGWDTILRNTEQRQWFILGILMRIFQRKIFDEELFGQNDQQRELLNSLDRALFQREGFSRQALRAEAVRTVIGRSPITENFYRDVAQLTGRVSLLLNPLTNYLYSLAPPAPAQTPNRIDLYQSLHSLISNAAYLSIAIRLSSTIFYFVPVSPGTAYDPDDHINFSAAAFTNSKQTIIDAYTVAAKSHVESLTPIQDLVSKLKRERREDTPKGKRAAYDLAMALSEAPMNPGNTHRALCGISAWPVITRFKAGGDEDDDHFGESNVAYLQEKDGFRIYPVSKGGAVFYYGRENRGSVADRAQLRLRHWVREKEKGKAKGESAGVLGTLVGFAAFVGAAGAALVLRDKGLDEVAELVKEGVAGLLSKI